MTALAKIAFVSILLVGLNWIAQSRPSLAGWIAAAPIVSLLSMALLLFDGADDRKVSDFMTAVLFGQIPNVIFLITFVALLARGISISVALFVGALIWGIAYVAAYKLGLFSH
jgi:hypothetical protein